MGNRLSKSDTVGSSTTASTGYAFDAANRLTATTGAGAATYASDADGNTTADGTRTDTWDSQNRLRECVAVDGSDPNTTHYSQYTYGADGLRRSLTTIAETQESLPQNGKGVQTNQQQFQFYDSAVYYAYDGTMPVRELHNTGTAMTPTATYLQGPSGPLYRRDDTQGEGNIHPYFWGTMDKILRSSPGERAEKQKLPKRTGRHSARVQILQKRTPMRHAMQKMQKRTRGTGG